MAKKKIERTRRPKGIRIPKDENEVAHFVANVDTFGDPGAAQLSYVPCGHCGHAGSHPGKTHYTGCPYQPQGEKEELARLACPSCEGWGPDPANHSPGCLIARVLALPRKKRPAEWGPAPVHFMGPENAALCHGGTEGTRTYLATTVTCSHCLKRMKAARLKLIRGGA